MSAHPFHTLVARAVRIVCDDIDTDQIIPARYLTTVSRNGLGEHLFADWRYDATRAPRLTFPLNRADAAGSQILVAGRNFGCGSSREHAPWALKDWGFRVVIATSFADIFRSNSAKNGLLTVALDERDHATLLALLERTPDASVTVNLEAQRVEASDAFGNVFGADFTLDPFTRRCLLEGVDELGLLMLALDDIATFERTRELVAP